jgi:hypothetical protein
MDNNLPIGVIESPSTCSDSSESTDDEPWSDALVCKAKQPSLLPAEPPSAVGHTNVKVFYEPEAACDPDYNKYLSWITVEDGHMVKIKIRYYSKYGKWMETKSHWASNDRVQELFKLKADNDELYRKMLNGMNGPKPRHNNFKVVYDDNMKIKDIILLDNPQEIDVEMTINVCDDVHTPLKTIANDVGQEQMSPLSLSKDNCNPRAMEGYEFIKHMEEIKKDIQFNKNMVDDYEQKHEEEQRDYKRCMNELNVFLQARKRKSDKMTKKVRDLLNHQLTLTKNHGIELDTCIEGITHHNEVIDRLEKQYQLVEAEYMNWCAVKDLDEGYNEDGDIDVEEEEEEELEDSYQRACLQLSDPHLSLIPGVNFGVDEKKDDSKDSNDGDNDSEDDDVDYQFMEYNLKPAAKKLFQGPKKPYHDDEDDDDKSYNKKPPAKP